MRDGYELFRQPQQDEAWWRSAVPSYRRARQDETAGLDTPTAFFASVPIIDMSIYLGWLEGEVRAQGAMFTERSVASMSDAHGAADVVINCTGLSARDTTQDYSVYGVRGQVQVVHAPHVNCFISTTRGRPTSFRACTMSCWAAPRRKTCMTPPLTRTSSPPSVPVVLHSCRKLADAPVLRKQGWHSTVSQHGSSRGRGNRRHARDSQLRARWRRRDVVVGLRQ